MKIVNSNTVKVSKTAKKYSFVWVSTWKVSKYGVTSGPYIPIFGLIREIYFVNLYIVFSQIEVALK